MIRKEELSLVKEWDKTFPISEKVDHTKVTFVNRYGITLAADMYIPKYVEGRLPAIAVSGPFGAVKEQCSGLYAQTMAERGFLTIAFDPSFTGESGGYPRYMASPDINTEDFMAAVDFLSLHENADPERIGILGINSDITLTVAMENVIHTYNASLLDSREPEPISTNVADLLDSLIDQSIRMIGKPASLMDKSEKIRAIRYLNDSGAFLITKSGPKVCQIFGIAAGYLCSLLFKCRSRRPACFRNALV